MLEKFPIINMQETGENLKKFRRLNHLKVADVQEVFGFSSPVAVYKWERGESFPALENLVVLSALYHTSIDSMLILESSAA